MKKAYRTTTGCVNWDERAFYVESVDDPSPPSEEGNWKLVGSAVGALRSSSETIFWFWEKEES